MISIKRFALIMGLGIGLAAGAVQSQTLYSFEDDDIDFILRPGDLATPVTTGSFGVGDILLSVFEIEPFTIGGANGIPAGQELTGLAAIEITSVIPGAPNGVGTVFNFGPTSLDAILTANGVAPLGFGGAAVAMWFNDATNPAGVDRNLELNRSILPATNCASLSDCITEGSVGDLFQVDGFVGDPDELWFATQTVPNIAGGTVIDTALATSNSLPVAQFGFRLSNLFNADGPVEYIDALDMPCGNPGPIADGCVQFQGSGPVTGGSGLVNGAVGHSDLDAQKFVGQAVPEPATLALFGAGLLAFGFRIPKREA